MGFHIISHGFSCIPIDLPLRIDFELMPDRYDFKFRPKMPDLIKSKPMQLQKEIIHKAKISASSAKKNISNDELGKNKADFSRFRSIRSIVLVP